MSLIQQTLTHTPYKQESYSGLISFQRDRRRDSSTVLECTHVNFSEMDLSQTELGQPFDFSDCVFTDCMFIRTILRGANLDNADFTGSLLCGADLTGATLFHTTFSGCDLSFAILSQVTGSDAELSASCFHSANLVGADLQACNFSYASLNQADLSQGRFDKSTFAGTNFREAILANTSFDYAMMLGASFEGTKYIHHVSWKEAQLYGANFTSVPLSAWSPEGKEVSLACATYNLGGRGAFQDKENRSCFLPEYLIGQFGEACAFEMWTGFSRLHLLSVSSSSERASDPVRFFADWKQNNAFQQFKNRHRKSCHICNMTHRGRYILP